MTKFGNGTRISRVFINLAQMDLLEFGCGSVVDKLFIRWRSRNEGNCFAEKKFAGGGEDVGIFQLMEHRAQMDVELVQLFHVVDEELASARASHLKHSRFIGGGEKRQI